jgi:aminoglycoside phosphotransferase (APT) family kinase protein
VDCSCALRRLNACPTPARCYHVPLFELRRDTAPAYLASRGYDPRTLRIEELSGGVSNTVLLVESPGRRLVVKQSLEKLQVEQDWFSDRSRVFRESASIRWLAPHFPAGALPEILFEDRANCLFAMTAAPAEAQSWKDLLMSGAIDGRVAERIGVMLGTIVRVSWRNAECERAFGDQTIFTQLRLDPYYRTTAQQHPALAKYFEQLMEESLGRRVSLVHGDWSPKNFLISSDGVMAIDFEVVHFGDPSFDSAFMLNHLLLKLFCFPEWSAAFDAAAQRFWDAFRSTIPGGTDWIEQATLKHLGCLLLARVDGKSPAEYLTAPEVKERVRSFAQQIIVNPPGSIRTVFDLAQGAAR